MSILNFRELNEELQEILIELYIPRIWWHQSNKLINKLKELQYMLVDEKDLQRINKALEILEEIYPS